MKFVQRKNVYLNKLVYLAKQLQGELIEELGLYLHKQVQERAKKFSYFSIALDESSDMLDTAQLLIFIRGINDSFEITE